MFAFSDRMDKEGYILDRDCSPNESPDRVKEEERGRMIGQNPKAEVAPFSSAEIEKKKEFSFQDGGRRERTGESHAKLRAKKQSRVSGQQLEWPYILKLSPKFRGKAEIILDKKIIDAFKPSCIKSCFPVKEITLSEGNPSKS